MRLGASAIVVLACLAAPGGLACSSEPGSSPGHAPEREPIHPRASTTPWPARRIESEAPRDPFTVRTVLPSTIPLDDGSKRTVAAPPFSSGSTTTHTVFSLSESAETGAA